MSIIAKMNVTNARSFEDSQRVELSCVCDDKLMAHYAPENENVVFTRYSPWGNATLQIAGPELSWVSREELYLIFQKGELEEFDDVAVFGAIRIVSITDYGGTSKHVEFAHARNSAAPKDGELTAFSLKMAIDNPAASDQFKPGESDWSVLIFRASQITKEEAIRRAHAVSK